MLNVLRRKPAQQPEENTAVENGNRSGTGEKPTSLRLQRKAAKESARRQREKLKQLDKSTERQNADLKKRLKKEAAPDSAQRTLRYKRMFEDGICEVEPGLYSKSFRISDINYQIAKRIEQEDTFLRYCEVLNYFEPNLHLQISIVNTKVNQEDFQRNMFYKLQGDSLDLYRKEMNRMLSERIQEGQNGMLREKYITFSAQCPDYSSAIQAMGRYESDLLSLFKSLGCDTQVLSGKERLNIMHSMLRPGEPFTFDYDYLIESSLDTRNFICPDSFDFSARRLYCFGDKVGQIIFLKDLPADLSDRLLSQLSDLPIDMTITLHINSVEQDKALALVKQKISFMEQQKIDEQKKALKSGYDPEMLPYELKYSLEQAQDLLNDLQNRNQRMFRMTMLISTYADDIDSLNDNVYQIMATARKNTCKMGFLDYLQEEGLNSCLPIGKNHVMIKRTMTTAGTAIFIPFTTQELFENGGMYYGINALSRNLILFDRKGLKAPNAFILGTPGGGKSFAAKREAIGVLLSDPKSEVIIIDPEREYTNVALNFDGEIVHISAGSKDHISPMDVTMDYSDDDDPLVLKQEFILSLMEVLIGGKYGLTATQRSLIDRACSLTYMPYFNNPGKNPLPTLNDYYDILCSMDEPEAKAIALSLELYIKGSLSTFSHPTNVNISKRLVVYDIRDLGKQLRTLGMLIVLDQIWNRITMNRKYGKRTWIYIDEIQLILTNKYAANYFFELWSRARKWGAIPTGITQNVETLLLSDLARRMLSNSDFILMLNQSQPDRVELANLLNISQEQLRFITNTEPGHGLMFAGKSVIPFVDRFPKDTQLYKMMTTKIEETSEHDKAV